MEWSALCEEFSRCVVTAENAADNVVRASNDDEGGDEEGDAAVADNLSAELDNALTSLNRKLIELHSRLKGGTPLWTGTYKFFFTLTKPWSMAWSFGFSPF